MFNTKNLIHDVKDVPSTWIFEHFLTLKEKLTGQDIKIRSIFNKADKVPSMCIYTDKFANYKYKDFSSGKSGSAVDLIKEMNGLTFYQAAQLVIGKYNDYILHNNGGYDVSEFKQHAKYKVTSYAFRNWSTQDQYFWTQFNIGSKLLEKYCVRPLDYYCMTKDDNELCIKGLYLYGYFKADGTLYKIYQPKTLDKKFIKVDSYVQGFEQLQGNNNLLITSSLKDIMSIKSLRLNIDIIAPDSENTILRQDLMEDLNDEYNNIVVLFDNDEPGLKAMESYKQKYPFIEIAVLPMSKDVSDSIKDFGAKEVRNRLVPILDKKLTNGSKKEESSKTKNSKNKECRDINRISILEFY
jgi:hypothetical protein